MTAAGLWAGSVAGRLAGRTWSWMRAAYAASLVGAVLGRVGSTLARWLGGSALVSLRSSSPRPSDPSASSLAGRVTARTYDGLTGALGEGRAGRAARAAGAAHAGSVVARRRWLGPAGVTLLAFAIARGPAALAGAVTPVDPARGAPAAAAWWAALAVLGLAGIVGLAAGLSDRAPEDGGAVPGEQRAIAALVAVGCAAIGAFAGLTEGVVAVLPILLLPAVIAGAAVLYRPEMLLPVLAAFPWLDWGARRALGGSGLAAVWDEAFLLGGFAALMFAVLFTRRADLCVTPLLAPLALAVVAGVGSVVVMRVPSEVGLFALRVTFQPLLFYFLGQLLPRDRRWVRAAVLVFLAASLLMALHGLFQYATNAPMPAKWVDARETYIATRAYSIVENPNGLGAFLLLGAMLAAGLASSGIAPRGRLAAAAVMVVLVAGVAVTFSRGAWLGLIVGVVALAALSRRKLLAGIVVAGLAAPLVVPRAFLERLTFAFSAEYLAKSAAAGRLLAWRTAAQHIVEHPWFGVGLGTFGGTSSFLFGYTKMWVDNFYLQLAAEGGLVLAVAFMWLLLRAAKGVVAGYLRASSPFERGVSAGVFAGCAAVAFANLTASVWETLVVGAGFWFLAGLAAAPSASTAGAEPGGIASAATEDRDDAARAEHGEAESAAPVVAGGPDAAAPARLRGPGGPAEEPGT